MMKRWTDADDSEEATTDQEMLKIRKDWVVAGTPEATEMKCA
jgi:hypothetical protein